MKKDSQEEQTTSWRDKFLIANFIGAILLIRALIQPSVPEAINTAGMDLSMIVGSFLAMWFNIFQIPMDETVDKKKGEMLGEMLLGMGLGMVAFMVTTQGVKTLFKLTKSRIDKCREQEESKRLLTAHEI